MKLEKIFEPIIDNVANFLERVPKLCSIVILIGGIALIIVAIGSFLKAETAPDKFLLGSLIFVTGPLVIFAGMVRYCHKNVWENK